MSGSTALLATGMAGAGDALDILSMRGCLVGIKRRAEDALMRG